MERTEKVKDLPGNSNLKEPSQITEEPTAFLTEESRAFSATSLLRKCTIRLSWAPLMQEAPILPGHESSHFTY